MELRRVVPHYFGDTTSQEFCDATPVSFKCGEFFVEKRGVAAYFMISLSIIRGNRVPLVRRSRLATRLAVIATALVLPGQRAGGQAKDFKPITDAVQLNPDPGDWLNFRRTLDGHGYAPSSKSPGRTFSSLRSCGRGACTPG